MDSRRSILIADDEAGIRDLLRTIFDPAFQIYLAADGQEALRCIQENPIDLVILDLKMPKVSGLDVLREIKKLKSNMEVIILTGQGTLTNAQEVIRHGVYDLVFKPFDVADIVSIVGNAFKRRNDRLDLETLIHR